MRIAIVDDEAVCLEEVRAASVEYKKERGEKNISIDTFIHPEDLLEAAEKIGGYDIYVLDVVMPDMNGIKLGNKLRDAGYDGKIIYLTSSKEYALDSYQVKAFDYLLKPVEAQSFFSVMDDAMASISEKKDKMILVKTKEKSVKLSLDHIMYAEFKSRAITYYCVKGRTVESISLRTSFAEAISELTADKRFTPCGQSMVVNLDHITEVEDDAVVFGDTYRAPMGEKNCRKLRAVWSSYLFDAED